MECAAPDQFRSKAALFDHLRVFLADVKGTVSYAETAERKRRNETSRIDWPSGTVQAIHRPGRVRISSSFLSSGLALRRCEGRPSSRPRKRPEESLGIVSGFEFERGKLTIRRVVGVDRRPIEQIGGGLDEGSFAGESCQAEIWG